MLLFLLSAWAGGARADAPLMALQHAEFQPLDGGSAWTPVPLPDTWGQRGLHQHGEGRYRLRFSLEAVPAEPLAVRFERISSMRQVMLNGHLIEAKRAAAQEHPIPAVIDLPWPLLRVGINEIDIELRYRSRGGLSSAWMGCASELRAMHDRKGMLSRELPRSLNMGMAVMGLFMLFIWHRRRSEAALGLFGALVLIGSLRNYFFFADLAAISAGFTDWAFFSTQVWIAALFLAFARRIREPCPLDWVDRSLLALCVLSPLVAAVFTPWVAVPLLRAYLYPVLLVIVCSAVFITWRTVMQHRDAMRWVLCASFALVLVAAFHDYLFQQSIFDLTDTMWLPFVMPLAMGAYGAMLMARLVMALSQVEQLNAELENRVAQRTSALQAANAAKTRFLASASHDLRQPVAAIGLLVSLLREQIESPHLRRMIARVDDAIAAMESMLKGLLDLSRLDSGATQVRRDPLALQTLFDAIALHEGEAAARKGVSLRFRPTGLAVQSDPVLLDQALRNLVSNAVRYTERGGVLVAARQRAPHHVLLQVWDTGVGIAEEDQAKVFDEFVQLGNDARERSLGLGLGLSIVQRSLRAMGLHFTLRSQTGRGSCFSVQLPRAQHVPRLPAAPPPHPAPATDSPLAGLRLMVIEDDPAVRASLIDRLSAWGAVVHACGSVDAFRQLIDVTFVMDGCDLLITDQRLPGGSGLEAIELARAEHGPVRALVITGDTAPDDLARFAASGVPVLHKPFRAEALLAAIEAALLAQP